MIVSSRRVREQRHLVRRVELHERAERPPRREEIHQATIREDPFDEVLAELGVAQPPFLLNRQRREPPQQSRSKQPAAVALGPSGLTAVGLDSLHAAAR